MEYYQIKYLVLVEGLHTIWAAGSKGPGMTFYSTFIICSVLKKQWYSTIELSTLFFRYYLFIYSSCFFHQKTIKILFLNICTQTTPFYELWNSATDQSKGRLYLACRAKLWLLNQLKWLVNLKTWEGQMTKSITFWWLDMYCVFC